MDNFVTGHMTAKDLNEIATDYNKKKGANEVDNIIGAVIGLACEAARIGKYSVSFSANDAKKPISLLFESSNYLKYLRENFIRKMTDLGYKVDYNCGDYESYESYTISFVCP